MSQDDRYRQLAMFSVIVAEVVITPLAIAGLIGWAFQAHPLRLAFAALGAFFGLGIAFFRIGRLLRKGRSDHDEGK